MRMKRRAARMVANICQDQPSSILAHRLNVSVDEVTALKHIEIKNSTGPAHVNNVPVLVWSQAFIVLSKKTVDELSTLSGLDKEEIKPIILWGTTYIPS